ncbi:hypothetical protein C8J56DRAFT_713257, partial [Mycena floridula]
MLRAGQKYGVELAGSQPTLETRNSMPLWHSIIKNPTRRQVNNGTRQHCLRTNHDALTIGSGSKVAERLSQEDHQPQQNCECSGCHQDRDSGCNNPHACAKAVSIRLTQLHPKWT